ncbi:hypothetical protein CC85DRAFT_301568 [Cutaneotrichosporon oleaginosum]|uniref:Uncharacterized protein n=1 Tax=Cutaneotrichosporon oleaginosum TaxID=879819 RepID=A0A0J0XQ14_9TREE|nr:uncharacterized protein CC85DRAFT_301568 [Cutaneotrichosporon oleaginosum]KLT43167.1 hypothetical protein CC85DRAFT_301568 [Cutaneotrichosporon oleaginosum]TXT09849.1 hypothetical protein COLE_03783 [Cutaneotrichosporon oleaginosum]
MTSGQMNERNYLHVIVNDLFPGLLPVDPLGDPYSPTPYRLIAQSRKRSRDEYEPENQTPVKRPCYPQRRPAEPLCWPPVRVKVRQPRRKRSAPIKQNSNTTPAVQLTAAPSLETFVFACEIDGVVTAITAEDIAQMHAEFCPTKRRASAQVGTSLALMRRIAHHADHQTRLTLRASTRWGKLASDAEFYNHCTLLATTDSAVLMTRNYQRLPLDPDRPIVPRIHVLDALYLQALPTKLLPLERIEGALETCQISLLRAEQFQVMPPARTVVAHTFPLTIRDVRPRADRLIWHPQTGCLQDCLLGLRNSAVGCLEVAIVLDDKPAWVLGAELLETLLSHLLQTQGKLTIVCSPRYAATFFGVPIAYDSHKATQWVRNDLREAVGSVNEVRSGIEGEEVVSRFTVVFLEEWRVPPLIKQRQLRPVDCISQSTGLCPQEAKLANEFEKNFVNDDWWQDDLVLSEIGRSFENMAV